MSLRYKLYDIFTKQVIEIHEGEVVDKCKQLGIDNTALAHLVHCKGKTSKCIKNRYILEENKHKIFTLVEFETGKEYDCINNKSLFIQLGILPESISDNETKYIYELKKGRQAFASICGRVFKLKNGKEKKSRFKPLKSSGDEYEKILSNQTLKNKIISRVRSRIQKAVKYKMVTNTKKDRTLTLLGCSISFYMGYLEAKFEPGMNWGNYGQGEGKWNLEHCVPCALFDMTKEEEQRKCFHYSNTKPMWSLENTAKNDKTPEEWEIFKKRRKI